MWTEDERKCVAGQLQKERTGSLFRKKRTARRNVASLRKLTARKGFTLIEMMACVLTLIMITLICTTGLNMAMKSYNESVFESGSQMLESMISTSVGDVLRYSSDVKEDVPGVVTFDNAAFGVDDGRFVLDTDGHVLLEKNATQQVLLIGTGVYIDSMYIADFTLDYDDSTQVYTGGYKIKSEKTGQERTVSFTFKSFIESL